MHSAAAGWISSTIGGLALASALFVLVVNAAVRIVVCILAARVVAKVLADEGTGRQESAVREHRVAVLQILAAVLAERRISALRRRTTKEKNDRVSFHQ